MIQEFKRQQSYRIGWLHITFLLFSESHHKDAFSKNQRFILDTNLKN